MQKKKKKNVIYRLSTPPSNDAFKHSGDCNLLCTSAIVTLYFDVLDSKLNLPGTEQKTSLWEPMPKLPDSLPLFIAAKHKNAKQRMTFWH